MSKLNSIEIADKKKKGSFFWLRIIFSFALISFLFYTVDVNETFSKISNVKVSFLLLSFIIAIGDRFLMAYKWGVLLWAKGLRLPLMRLTGTYLISTFIGFFLPATVGGDAVRAYAVSRTGYSSDHVISSILIERLFGFLALFIFVLVSIIVSILLFKESFFTGILDLFWIFSVLLFVSILLIYVSVNERVFQLIKSIFSRFRINVRKFLLFGKLDKIYASYRSYKNNKFELAIFLALSLIENLFPLFWTYCLALAFDIQVPLLYFFILMPIVLVLVRLPISFDGIGIQEGAFVFFLALIGVPKSEAFLLGISSHVIAILSVMPGGVLYALNGLSVLKEPDEKESNHTENMISDLKSVPVAKVVKKD